MVDAGQVRLSASKIVFWKWAFGIGVGAACAGAVVVVERGPAVPPFVVVSPAPVAQVSPPIEATGMASIGGTPLTTASVDVTTAMETPPPATMLPLEKPKSAISKIFRVRETTPTGVTHFETCLPSCETRDPQVVGQEQAGLAPAPVPPVAVMPPVPVGPVPPALIPPAAAVMPPPLDAAEEPLPLPPQKGVVDLAVDGSRHILHQVEGASNAVVDGTRRALGAAVDLVW